MAVCEIRLSSKVRERRSAVCTIEPEVINSVADRFVCRYHAERTFSAIQGRCPCDYTLRGFSPSPLLSLMSPDGSGCAVRRHAAAYHGGTFSSADTRPVPFRRGYFYVSLSKNVLCVPQVGIEPTLISLLLARCPLRVFLRRRLARASIVRFRV